MSMISAQCDELRRLANTLDTRYRYADDIATALREAADTILSLRDRAQELQAHNAKLRKERDMYRDLVGMMDHPDLNAQLQAENAKLRELLQRTWDAFHDATAREFVTVKNELRELGIEVTS